MPEISLPPFHLSTTRAVSVPLNYDLAQDLERYRAFYKQVYGAEVSESELLREMARRFMEADRQFQAQKHGIKPRSKVRQQSTAASAPAATE